VRPATVAAAALACAAAAMVVVAFVAGDGGEERAATAPEPVPAAAAVRDGEAVWVANGCGSCHTFRPANARATLGPDLGASLKGMPASYIRESIVNPNANYAPGWEGGVMPDDFAQRIPPPELDALVEFIRGGVRD
jgi:cytochrome c oxidase subunit II